VRGSAGVRLSRVVLVLLLASWGMGAAAQEPLPELTGAVNDFAGVIGQDRERRIDAMSRALLERTGDAVVVATVKTIAPYGDIRAYAVELFENRGRGIGAKGQDNGLLVLLAVDERRVWIEVGYGLEPFITDGFAGETSREYMVPAFRRGDYGAGLEAGVGRLIARIADRRNVEVSGVPRVVERRRQPALSGNTIFLLVVLAFIVIQWISAVSRFNRRGRRDWGRRRTWSGWQSGVGPFGGGFGGGWGSGGGGFGGGFGGFGGGRSGGGGGGASW
jgi:uncharacterized protein